MTKILVVDDDLLIRYSLKKVLSAMGLDVRTVSSGQEAIRELGALSPELCFLDVHLPDMNGLDIQREMKQRAPQTKILLMSGSYIDEQLRKGIEEAAFFMTKPFTISQVKAIIRQFLPGNHDLENTGNGASHPERRTRTRAQYSIPCRYRASGADQHATDLAGEIIDITERGMGMYTDRPFESGRIIHISWDDLEKQGIVRWGMTTDDPERYRLGIEFL